MGDLVEMANRCVAQIFTVAEFRRPVEPKRCSRKGYYHVWRWFGGPRPSRSLHCQCGLFDSPPEGMMHDK